MPEQITISDAIDAPIATPPLTYFGSRISDRLKYTPEGYLVCLDVPIARTGWQDYEADEIGAASSGRVRVWRDPKEVFSPETIASFEGKPVTDAHPPVFLNPQNFAGYIRGHAQNVRASSLLDENGERLLLADLLIYDAVLIDRVRNGYREVSAGYSCDYEPLHGEDYAQRNIRGNHIAVVNSGRAGTARINDELKETSNMAEPTTATQTPSPPSDGGLGMLQSILKFAKDELGWGPRQRKMRDDDDDEPDEQVERESSVAKKGEEAEEKRAEDKRKARDTKRGKAKDGNEDDWHRAVTDRLAALEKSAKAKDRRTRDDDDDDDDKTRDDDDDKKARDDDEGEEPSEKPRVPPPATEDDHDLVPVETLSKEDRPKNPIPGADKALDELRRLRPLIARHGTKDQKIAYNAALCRLKGKTYDSSRIYGELNANRRKPEAVERAEQRSGAQVFDENKTAKDGKFFEDMCRVFHKRNPQEVMQELVAQKHRPAQQEVK